MTPSVVIQTNANRSRTITVETLYDGVGIFSSLAMFMENGEIQPSFSFGEFGYLFDLHSDKQRALVAANPIPRSNDSIRLAANHDFLIWAYTYLPPQQ